LNFSHPSRCATDPNQRQRASGPTPEVERRPGGRGQGDAANQPPFVVEQLVAVDEDAVDRLAVPSVKLG
jgi:hypothetical protein